MSDKIIPEPVVGIKVTEAMANLVNPMDACKTVHINDDYTQYTTQDALWALINLYHKMTPEMRAEVELWSGHKVRKDENGLLHADKEPALITREGYEGWYQRGYRHRLDGPAITREDGTLEYWEDGKLIKRVDPNGVDITNVEAVKL